MKAISARKRAIRWIDYGADLGIGDRTFQFRPEQAGTAIQVLDYGIQLMEVARYIDDGTAPYIRATLITSLTAGNGVPDPGYQGWVDELILSPQTYVNTILGAPPGEEVAWYYTLTPSAVSSQDEIVGPIVQDASTLRVVIEGAEDCQLWVFLVYRVVDLDETERAQHAIKDAQPSCSD